MKLAIVLETRPKMIRMTPIIKEDELLGVDYFVLHMGQHYSQSTDKVSID